MSFSKNSDWDPAIAAAPNGEVAIAWDTYDKGDYDVYFRRLRLDGGVKMDAPVPVAVGPSFEARASVAYDSQNRLWVAYEGSDTKWGKDYGAYGNPPASRSIRTTPLRSNVFRVARRRLLRATSPPPFPVAIGVSGPSPPQRQARPGG